MNRLLLTGPAGTKKGVITGQSKSAIVSPSRAISEFRENHPKFESTPSVRATARQKL